MTKCRTQYESMSMKIIELQKIIEREETERNNIIESRTQDLHMQVQNLQSSVQVVSKSEISEA